MRSTLISILSLLVLVGCGADTNPPSDNESPSAAKSSEPPASDPDKVTVEELAEDMDRAAAIAENFWRDHWSDFFTGEYTSPEVVGLYDGHEASAPTCNGDPLEADNAYYCPEGDYVAWDASLMVRGAEMGDSWVYLVIAHEWGHAIQARLDVSLRVEAEELQADCLAGAIIYGSAEDGTLVFEQGDEKELGKALVDLSDETPWTESGDHGGPFERIEAFRLGRDGGVEACLPEEVT